MAKLHAKVNRVSIKKSIAFGLTAACIIILGYTIARMDAAAVWLPLREHLQLLIALVVALLLGAGAGGYEVWRRQQMRFYQERYQAIEALRASEVSYRRQFVDNSAVMLLIDPSDGRIIDANSAALSFYGYARERLMAMNISEINTLSPSEVKRAMDSVTPEQGSRFEFRHLLADGSVRDVDVATSRIRFGDRQALHSIVFDITPRKRAENALLERDEELSAIYENAPLILILVDEERRVHKINDRGAAFANTAAADMIGLRSGEALRCLHALDDHRGCGFGPYCRQCTVRKTIKDTFENGKSHYHVEAIVPLSSGEEGKTATLLLSTAKLLVKQQPLALVSMLDISERKRAEEALLTSEIKFRKLSRQFNALLDTLPDTITLLAPDLKIVWGNKNTYANLHKDPADLIGGFCYALRHKKTAPCDPCPVMKSFRTGEPAMEITRTPEDKTWELRTIPLREDGRVVNVIEVGRDITEHRKLEEQLRHAVKMESIGTLAGGIAHDFNNILTAIIGYGEVALLKMSEDDPVRQNIKSMLEGAERAAYLTKGLLTFSRKQVINKSPVDLQAVIKRLEQFLARIIGEDIEFKTTASDGTITVLADAHQLEQVLMNLATNARDAMPRGGAFTVTLERIRLDERFIATHGYGKQGEYGMITAADTGMGMAETVRQRIFEPFFTTKEVGKGTGLGLSIIYAIIKQHEGYINVYSEPGIGTTFRIYLPASTTGPVGEQKSVAEALPRRGSETILLAEDDESLRMLDISLLEEFGYTVIAAIDGKDAVKKFVENMDEIHLLLFDLVMPRKSGKAAYDDIRKLRSDLPVIFMSGYAPDFIRQRELAGDSHMLVTKPVSPMHLLHVIRKVLEEKGTDPGKNGS